MNVAEKYMQVIGEEEKRLEKEEWLKLAELKGKSPLMDQTSSTGDGSRLQSSTHPVSQSMGENVKESESRQKEMQREEQEKVQNLNDERFLDHENSQFSDHNIEQLKAAIHKEAQGEDVLGALETKVVKEKNKGATATIMSMAPLSLAAPEASGDTLYDDGRKMVYTAVDVGEGTQSLEEVLGQILNSISEVGMQTLLDGSENQRRTELKESEVEQAAAIKAEPIDQSNEVAQGASVLEDEEHRPLDDKFKKVDGELNEQEDKKEDGIGTEEKDGSSEAKEDEWELVNHRPEEGLDPVVLTFLGFTQVQTGPDLGYEDDGMPLKVEKVFVEDEHELSANGPSEEPGLANKAELTEDWVQVDSEESGEIQLCLASNGDEAGEDADMKRMKDNFQGLIVKLRQDVPFDDKGDRTPSVEQRKREVNMNETETYMQRLQTIVDKRRLQEEEKRLGNEEWLQLAQLKRKFLRDCWLMDQTSSNGDGSGPQSPAFPSPPSMDESVQESESLESELRDEELSDSDHIIEQLKRTIQEEEKEKEEGEAEATPVARSSSVLLQRGPSERTVLGALEIKVIKDQNTGATAIKSMAPLSLATAQVSGVTVFDDGRMTVYAVDAGEGPQPSAEELGQVLNAVSEVGIQTLLDRSENRRKTELKESEVEQAAAIKAEPIDQTNEAAQAASALEDEGHRNQEESIPGVSLQTEEEASQQVPLNDKGGTPQSVEQRETLAGEIKEESAQRSLLQPSAPPNRPKKIKPKSKSCKCCVVM